MFLLRKTNTSVCNSYFLYWFRRILCFLENQFGEKTAWPEFIIHRKNGFRMQFQQFNWFFKGSQSKGSIKTLELDTWCLCLIVFVSPIWLRWFIQTSLILICRDFPWIQPTSELVKEIATLELEVINLERYLLSLYRTAFDQYRVNSQLECIEESSQQKSKLHIEYLNSCEVNSDHQASRRSDSQCCNEIQKKRDIDIRHAGNISAHDLASTSNMSNVPFERDEPYKVCAFTLPINYYRVLFLIGEHTR